MKAEVCATSYTFIVKVASPEPPRESVVKSEVITSYVPSFNKAAT